MKAKITAVKIDEQDRTVDMTVQLYADNGTLMQTVIKLTSVDTFSLKTVIDILQELLADTITSYEPIPYTEAQIEAEILNMEVVKPGGPTP
jgi:hypothetical protein